MKKRVSPKPWFFPRPLFLLTTQDRSGKDNIITISWAGVACTKPPMVTVSIRKSRHSHAVICDTREFVVNIPTSKHVTAIELCGTSSGRDTDKFKALGLAKSQAVLVRAPLIADCPINLECQVRQVMQLGSHDLFVAEVVRTHAQHSLLREDDEVNDEALDCLAWGAEEIFRVLRMRKQTRLPSL
jgi:flavin reductase (DIM6/NTAB) family NADH-FMN oxidoreductase RutF